MNPQTDPPLICKVCDRGNLVPKKIFRMSGPVVAIGYILLVPSIIGMFASALIFLGVITYKGDKPNTTSLPTQSFQEGFDGGFRQNCATSFAQNYQQASGTTAPPLLIVEYCECALSAFKETYSETEAAQSCIQRVKDGSLAVPDQKIQDLYSKPVNNAFRPQSEPIGNWFHILGGSFAIFLAVASFVSGLLGWLLVMKKRVLKCSVCGAVINAS